MILREHSLDNWLATREIDAATAQAYDALINVDFMPPASPDELARYSKAELIEELTEIRGALGAFRDARESAFEVFEDLVERVV